MHWEFVLKWCYCWCVQFAMEMIYRLTLLQQSYNLNMDRTRDIIMKEFHVTYWQFILTYSQCFYLIFSSNYNDFLQRSIMPTHHFQKSLPRLPIPQLEKSCERYLRAQEPLLSHEEFRTTEAIVGQFRDGEGKGGLHECNTTNHQSAVSTLM